MSGPKRILIIGGVAGGASAAARARRLSEEAEIVLFERGSHVSFANCGLPYHIGGIIQERKRLIVQTPESLFARYDIDVRVETEVLAIDRRAREISVRSLRDGREYRQPYDALVLSPGAEPIRPAIPGIEDPRVFTLRNMADMDAILRALDATVKRTALIAGAGYIGLEMAEALRHRGLAVTLVEKLDQVLAMADPEMATPLQAELLRQGVELRLGRSIEAFEPRGERLRALLSDGGWVDCGIALLAVGVRPETKLARDAGLDLGATGGIRVDDRMRTSDPNIWAVGDAVEVRNLISSQPALLPLAGPANRQGRIAAENIMGRDRPYKATQGTAICKVFDLVFAMTGLTETGLLRSQEPYRKVYLQPPDHAAYYPDAHPIFMKLLFSPSDGRVLGAQAVGATGVDKRIDVLAVAIRCGLTVFDLEDLELCYAPPFGSAKDAVNMAGFVASNVLRSDVVLWEPEELASVGPDRLLVDVRTFEEHSDGTIPGAICVPLDELRDRLDELPREKELLVFCHVGLRGYLASRALVQRGFRARNLSGGYRRYLMWKGESAFRLTGEGELRED